VTLPQPGVKSSPAPVPRSGLLPMRVTVFLLMLLFASLAARADPGLPLVWPDPETLDGIQGEIVAVPSSTPFTLSDVGDPDEAPPRDAQVRIFLPEGASAEAPVPAVVFLHGAAGVLSSRGPQYARQLSAMGVAGVVVDVFGARRDLGTGFVDRLMNITEAAMLADAFAVLGWLDAMPEIDGDMVILMGFSYGGMATLYAVQEQVAETLLPGGPRFAAHVAYYAPCIARFEDNRTTGAPVLALAGDGDAIVDPERCAETDAALEEGGSAVTRITYEDAYHQWDGRFSGPRPIGRNLAPCSFVVEDDGDVHDSITGFPMTGPFLRKIILGVCTDSEGYLIGRDDEVRDRALAEVSVFLNEVFHAP